MPLVAEVSLAYFLVKFVRYSFYMWLPTYLEGSLQYDAVTAGYLSISFEVGGVAASAGMAWVTKKFFNGNDLNSCRTSLGLASVGLLLFLATSNWGVAFNCVFLAMVGAGVRYLQRAIAVVCATQIGIGRRRGGGDGGGWSCTVAYVTSLSIHKVCHPLIAAATRRTVAWTPP